MTDQRGLDELVHPTEDGWPILRELLDNAGRPVEVEPRGEAAAESTLIELQVTTRSMLGTLAYRTGGLMVDGGYLRILGSGGDRVGGGLREWNDSLGGRQLDPPIDRFLIVAYDVLGGFFAMNGGAMDGPPGAIHYWAPDTWRWEPLNLGHGDFVSWALSSESESFYEAYRWLGWRDEVAAVGPDEAISMYPPLGLSAAGISGEDIGARTRAAVPAAELWTFTHELARQTAGLTDGDSFRLEIKD